MVRIVESGRIAVIGPLAELKDKVGPDKTLDNVLISLVAADTDTKTESSYGEVRRARLANRGHG